MLPILRIIPVGGVFLAIAILVLSLGAPGGSHTVMAPMLSARGPLQQIDEHPEWRQFLIRAALARADELGRLRELPDEPVRSAPEETKVAGLPIERSDADPEDITDTINDAPAATIPIEIGETSSTELPTIRPDDRPPVVKTPAHLKSQNANRKKVARRFRRTKPPKPEPPALNFFEVLFGATPAQQASTAAPEKKQPATGRLKTSQR
jgi:hypothetical protein